MRTLDLVAVGDISLACPTNHVPFEDVARYLRAGDIVFGNLECVLCDTGTPAEKEITLRASPTRAEYLHWAGFDVVSLANNHVLDFGSVGLAEMFASLRRHGILFVGAGDRTSTSGYEIIERRGLRVGFLAYGEANGSPIQDGVFVNRICHDTILDQLRTLKPQCDVAVVSLHWGIEYLHYPSPGQIKLARELVAEGAHLVLGHHPHVLQGIEMIGTSLIAYSLGSFHFRPVRTEGSRQSCILHARVSERGVERYRLVPVQLNGEDRPYIARGEDRKAVTRLIRKLSVPIREGRITEKWWFEQVAPVYLQGNVAAWRRRIRRYGIGHFKQFLRWLVSGFTIKCYLGLLRRRLGFHE